MSGSPRAFDSQWLERRLTELLPDFPGVSLCVALSGGVDSTALLAALALRRGAHPRLRAVHINHGLQRAAGRFRAQCKALAARFGIPLRSISVNVDRAHGTSLEAQARSARYAAFERELKEGEVLLTAQHQDDQLETVLLQLLRGAGVAGLAAMPDLTRFGRGFLARPLLPVTRASLEAWAREQGLTWIEDEMNEDERFDRVYLRRRLLPLLKTRWPGAGGCIARSARHIAEAQRLLNRLALADVERAIEGDSLSVKKLRALDPDRRRNALRFWIVRHGVQAPNTARLEELAGPLLDARHDATPQIEWNGTSVRRHKDLLTLNSPNAAYMPLGK